MPTYIFDEQNHEKIASFGRETWSLPEQIDLLTEWLTNHEAQTPVGKYSADIGFKVRPEASGGGAALSVNAMGIMTRLGMELLLSEYQ